MLQKGANFSFNTEGAQNDCVNSNATLWEVLQGEAEWNAIYQSLDEGTRRDGVWINAKALETCSEHLGKISVVHSLLL